MPTNVIFHISTCVRDIEPYLPVHSTQAYRSHRLGLLDSRPCNNESKQLFLGKIKQVAHDDMPPLENEGAGETRIFCPPPLLYVPKYGMLKIYARSTMSTMELMCGQQQYTDLIIPIEGWSYRESVRGMILCGPRRLKNATANGCGPTPGKHFSESNHESCLCLYCFFSIDCD